MAGRPPSPSCDRAKVWLSDIGVGRGHPTGSRGKEGRSFGFEGHPAQPSASTVCFVLSGL